MLSRSSKIKTSSAIRSPDSVQPLQDYISKPHTPANFPAVAKDLADNEKKEEEDSSASEDKRGQKGEDFREMDLLLPRNNFQELFNRFFILGHKQLLMLQARIRQERGVNRSTKLMLRDIDNHQVHILRGQYYQLQMILFNMSKGNSHSSFT